MNRFISFLFNLPVFSGERQELLKAASIDAFVKAREDVLETFQGDVEARAEEIATQRLQSLLSVVDERSIVTFNHKNGLIYIGGELAEAGQLNGLKSEAEFLVQSDLWKLIYESPKSLAEKAMFSDDGNLDNLLLKGRVMLYTIGTQKKIVETFKNLEKRM